MKQKFMILLGVACVCSLMPVAATRAACWLHQAAHKEAAV